MTSHLHFNYLAILAAIAIKVALGYFWYGAWFGKAWARERGILPHIKPMPSVVRSTARRARYLRWFGVAVTVMVLALAMAVIRPSTWGVGPDLPAVCYGMLLGASVWAAFCVTPLLARVGWEGASWKLLWIHAGYHFFALQGACLILAVWR